MDELNNLLALVGQSYSTLQTRAVEPEPEKADRRDRFVAEFCDWTEADEEAS